MSARNPDPTRGVAESNEKAVIAKELTIPAATQRYRRIAQVGSDPEKGYKLNLSAMVWIPLSEENPSRIGFAEHEAFHLIVPKREVINPETKLTMPWFLSVDRYSPLFPEATMAIANFCNARRADNGAAAFNNNPAMGALPGFFYESERNAGFRVNPQSFYASHILFFTTGYTFDGQLSKAAKIATESSVRMYFRTAEDEVVTMFVIHAHLLSVALGYPNTLAMLQELFISPFNLRYGGADKLMTIRAEEILSSGIKETDERITKEFTRLASTFNSVAESYWTTYRSKQPNWKLVSIGYDMPKFTLEKRALIYRVGRREKYLRLNDRNLTILGRLIKVLNDAMEPGLTPKERDQTMRKLFSVVNGFDEFGMIPSTVDCEADEE